MKNEEQKTVSDIPLPEKGGRCLIHEDHLAPCGL